jgi:alpha-galactosidase/6-phospho-beta-glucosidase family protein
MEKTEFAKDSCEFFEQVRDRIDVPIEQATILYAIYRKDLRADRLNNGNVKTNSESQRVTQKQKNYLMDLAEQKSMCLAEQDVNKMTKEQASKMIDTLTEGGLNSSLSSSTCLNGMFFYLLRYAKQD